MRHGATLVSLLLLMWVRELECHSHNLQGFIFLSAFTLWLLFFLDFSILSTCFLFLKKKEANPM